MGVDRKATRKLMKEKKLKIDGSGRAKEFRRVGDNGKAIAMVGWGHLVCPFYGGRGVEVRG